MKWLGAGILFCAAACSSDVSNDEAEPPVIVDTVAAQLTSADILSNVGQIKEQVLGCLYQDENWHQAASNDLTFAQNASAQLQATCRVSSDEACTEAAFQHNALVQAKLSQSEIPGARREMQRLCPAAKSLIDNFLPEVSQTAGNEILVSALEACAMGVGQLGEYARVNEIASVEYLATSSDDMIRLHDEGESGTASCVSRLGEVERSIAHVDKPIAPTPVRLQARDVTPAASSDSSEEAWSLDEAAIIQRWLDANGRCRGGSGDDSATWMACKERDGEASAELRSANICYGREGEYGYQHEMHRCDTDSL